MNAANHFAVMPTKALKGTQSADANHWISLVFSSSNTGLQMGTWKVVAFVYGSCLMPEPAPLVLVILFLVLVSLLSMC